MSVHHRFFRITSGPLVEKIHELQAGRLAANDAYIALCEKLGATNALVWESGNLAGFTFDHEPCQQTFRKDGKTWMPRKGTKAGKALWKEIQAIPVAPSVQHALEVVGLHCRVPSVIDGNRGYTPGISGFFNHNIWFVKLPWKQVDPQVMAEYREAHEAGNRWCAELEYLQWTPPADWEELKEWQYLKEMEELGERPAA